LRILWYHILVLVTARKPAGLKPHTIDDPVLIAAIQDEIRRSDEARYDHRLHAILLVAEGMTCSEVATVFDDSVRTIQSWVRRFEEKGFAGLAELDRSGRPPRLNEKQLKEIERILRASPRQAGMDVNLWDGKTLSAFIKKRFGIILGVRQCQRLFRQLGFRLRKPRPKIAHADPSVQEEFKKNS
jgi:transposase